MVKGKYITIELAKNIESEYIIKDKIGITIGSVFIVEVAKENRFCNYRIKFDKERTAGYEELKEALYILTMFMFKKMDMFKVNFFVEEDISTAPFVHLGFTLEGVLSYSIVMNNCFKSELLFGINRNEFEKGQRVKAIFLKGKRVELRTLEPENAPEVLSYYKRNKEHLREFEPARDARFYTLTVQKHVLLESYKQFLNGHSVNFGIYIEEKLIGKIQLSNIVMGVFKNAFVGYSMDREYQGNGYMKESLELVLKYAYEQLNLHRIEASTLVNNIKSQKVLKNCGFKEIGLNEKYLFIDGKWRDHLSFCKIKKI